MKQDLELISKETKEIHRLVKVFIQKRKLQTGGCKTFYLPSEWQARKEELCQDAVLILVYDGSEVKRIANGSDPMSNTFRKYLDKHGYYLEQGLHWYCGIYKKD